MAGRLTTANLQERDVGHHLEKVEWNAVVRSLRTTGTPGEGFQDEGHASSAGRIQARLRPMQVKPCEDIPAYSVFGISDLIAYAPYDVARAQASQLRTAVCGSGSGGSDQCPGQLPGSCGSEDPDGPIGCGSPFLILTNGSRDISAGNWGWGFPMGPMEPSEYVNYIGTDPKVGDYLGIQPNTFSVAVGYIGLICTSGPDVPNGRVQVAGLGGVVDIMGIADSDIPAASGTTLGAGFICVEYRLGSDANGACAAQTGCAWLLPVWNIGTLIEEGARVTAECVTGVGYVVRGAVGGSTERIKDYIQVSLQIQSSLVSSV